MFKHIMKSVIVVDERIKMRQLISKLITKELAECNLLGEAATVDEFTQLMILHEPDIVIANIDNLDKSIFDIKSKTKFILLADKVDKENISIVINKNVFNVLLEFSCDALEETVKKLLACMKREEKEILRSENRNAYCTHTFSYVRQRILYDLLVGNYGDDFEKIKNDLEKNYLEISGFYIILFSVKPKDGIYRGEDNQILLKTLKSFQASCSEMVNIYHIFVDMRNLVIIFKDDLEYFTEKNLYRFCKKSVDDIFKENSDLYVNVAISSKGRDYQEVPVRYSECLEEIRKANSKKSSHIFSISRVRRVYENQNFRKRMIMHRKDFINALSIEDFKNAEYYMLKIIEESCNITEDEWDFAERFYTHLILELDDIRREVSDETSFGEINLYSLEKIIRECVEIEELNDILKTTVKDLTQKMIGVGTSKLSKSIIEAIEFIDENFQKAITLEDVAAHIHLSPIHVSRIFNKETGESIKSYLNKLRVNKAKSLIKTGKFRISEVSEKVGFDDQRYFSTVFKKYVGISPTEYRESIRGN